MITDANGDHVRTLDLPDASGLQRVTWNLRRDPAELPAGSRGGRGRQGALVGTGPYTATIGLEEGDTFIGYGEPQTILVVPLQR